MSRLDFLLVEPTTRCGLTCPLCPTGLGRTPRARGDLDPAVLDGFLASVAPARPRVGMWGWGEPTLHARLPELVRVAHRHGCAVEIQSNGHGEAAVYEALLDVGLERLTIAFDGLDEAQMRPLRGARAEPARVRALLTHLAPRRGTTEIVLQCIVTRANEDHLEAIEAWARALGLSVERKTLNTTGAPPALAERLIPRRVSLRRPGGGAGRACPFLASGATLLADGTVVPCCYDWAGRWSLGHATDPWPTLAGARAAVDPEHAPLCRGCALSGLRPAEDACAS